MARATFVKAAQRNYTEDETGIEGGIKKGQSYYWWKFRRGGKRFSLTQPKPQQLTQSAFYSTLYDIGDMIGELEGDDSLQSTIPDVISALEELRDETQGSLDNMPDSLQQGPTGELLQERIDGLESAISTLKDIDLSDFDREEFDREDVENEREDDESEEDYEARMREAEEEHKAEQDRLEQEHWEGCLQEAQDVDLSIG